MGGRTPLDPAVVPVPGASVSGATFGPAMILVRPGTRSCSPTMTATGPPVRLSGRDEGRRTFSAARISPSSITNARRLSQIAPPRSHNRSFSTTFGGAATGSTGGRWARAPWAGRAGLSAVVHRGAIYVMGGSYNDDSSIVGGQPERVFFNDVWKSYDGAHWVRLTEAAPWAPHAGAIVVSKNGNLYLIGGEDGFTCESGDHCPPYYNDVWRSRDGRNWQLVTDAAPWPARPGHQAVVVQNRIVLFRWIRPAAPTPATHLNLPIRWTCGSARTAGTGCRSATRRGTLAVRKTSDADFDALVVNGSGRGWQLVPTILTFGGDHETFNFFDPFNYLNVDNDVWKFAAPRN